MSLTRCAVRKAKQLAGSDASSFTRYLHASSTYLAQATVKPALRLRSQNAPRLQPQNGLRLRPQNAPIPKVAATTPRKSTETVTKARAKENQPTYFGVKQTEGALKEQFTALLDYVAPRVGLKREVKDGKQIRQSAWSTLLQHAESKEDVEKVVDLMPQWAASKNAFGSDVATWLLKRCYDFKCPELAFRVLNDPIKYNIPVPSLDAATQLVAALVRRSTTKDASTLEHIGTLTAVMEHQQLPPLGSNFVSSIVTIRALVDPAMKTSASQRIARDLLLSLVGHIKSGKHDQLIPASDSVGFWALHSALPAIQKWTTAADNHCRGQGRVIFDFREKLGLLAENEERPEYFKHSTPRAKSDRVDAPQTS